MPHLNPAVLRTLALVGVGLSVATLLLLPAVILRLPVDHFAEEREDRRPKPRHPVLALVLALLRNALGLVLVAAGVAMLVLPGQGLLTLLAGLGLLDFPGKRRLELALATRPIVWKALQGVRRRGQREPLER